MNKNMCLNCGDKVRRTKRRDAVFCNHSCRMVVANARNHGRRWAAQLLRDAGVEKPSPVEVKQAWSEWNPPEEMSQPLNWNGTPKAAVLDHKPKITSDDIMAIIEELHG